MELSYLQSLGLAAVLEDCSNWLDIQKGALDNKIYRTDRVKENREITRLTILKENCQDTSQMISQLSSELEGKQTFTLLMQVLEDQKKRRHAKEELEEMKLILRRKEDELEEMCKYTRALRRQQDERMSESDRKELLEKDFEIEFFRTRKLESLLEEELERLKIQIRNEGLIHEEPNKILQAQNEALQQTLHEWEKKSEQLVAEKREEFNFVRTRRMLDMKILVDLKTKYKELEEVVVNDRKEKERLQAETTAAIRLQAWWRKICKKKTEEKNAKGKKKKKAVKKKKKKK